MRLPSMDYVHGGTSVAVGRTPGATGADAKGLQEQSLLYSHAPIIWHRDIQSNLTSLIYSIFYTAPKYL